MSAKWRRNKRKSKRLDISKPIGKAQNKKRSRWFYVRNPKSKTHTVPSCFSIGRFQKGKRIREPGPLIDVLERKDEILVVAGFSGFNRENMRVYVKDQRLILSAEELDRKYYKSLNLPKRVIPETMRTKYKNGVLEILLKKVVEEKPIGKAAD